jgi:hypothetical protein
MQSAHWLTENQNRNVFKKDFFNWYSGGGVQLGPLDTAATNGLSCQYRVIMMMEKFVEWWLAGETEVLGENLPQCRFVHHKPNMLPGREPGPPRWEAIILPLELRHGLNRNIVQKALKLTDLR